MKAIQTEGAGKEYVHILEDYNASMIVALRESLHTIVNDVVASIKMTNPDQATIISTAKAQPFHQLCM